MPSPHWIRRALGAFAIVALVGACAGDDTDNEADATRTTATTRSDSPDTNTAEPDDTSPSETAQPPPGTDVHEDEGLDNPVVAIADLSAEHVVPGPGSAGTTGRFELVAARDDGFCVDLAVENAPPGANAAHLHVGAAGESGPIAVDLALDSVQPATTDDVMRWSDVCQPAEASLIESLVVSTDAYYVQVHSDEYPDGAVRGQLAASSLFDLELS